MIKAVFFDLDDTLIDAMDCHIKANEKAFTHFGISYALVEERTKDNDFLGKILEYQVISDMKDVGIDASGENGEYHTVVIDGPIFSFPLQLEKGQRVIKDGYGFLDVWVYTSGGVLDLCRVECVGRVFDISFFG